MKVMNPNMDLMSNSLKEIIAQKVTSCMTNDNAFDGLSKQMFDEGERTEIEGMDPASIRLRGYQRRNLNMSHLGSKIDSI
jgi:hypothetical protein